MYTEEPRRSIDWGNVLKKGLLILIIALVIFLIIWLFVRNNHLNNTNVNNNNNNNNSTNNSGLINDTDFYTKEFIDNFRYFHDDAKEYFLVSELPKEGQTIKYTLQELIDKGIMLPFGYQGKTCDAEASYVTVTNTNGKYNMTTTLVCGTEVAKTTIELGCNQLCVSGNCTVEVANPEDLVNEYRYKQAYSGTENVYACPAGYTKSGSGKNTICLKGDETTKPATKVVSYNCPTGYTKNVSGDKVTCTKDTSTSTKPIEKVTYSCPSGYLTEGNDETKCIKSSSNFKEANVSYTYSCPSGTDYQTGSGYDYQTGSGSSLKCYKSKTVNATPSCSQGTLSNGKCVISGTTTTLIPTKTNSYGCPSGYSVYSGSGSSLRCYRRTSSGYYNYYSYYHNTTYGGCTYSGTVLQSCGTNCSKTVYAYYCGASYSYKNGIVTGTSYKCPSGTDYQTGSGSNLKCYKNATPERTVNPTYTCSKGTLSGTSCVIKDGTLLTTTKTPSYSCEDGYSLNGNRCFKRTQDVKDAVKQTTYSCPAGFEEKGTGKNMSCVSTGKDTQNAIKHTEYKCEAGYTKFGLGELAKCTKGKVESVKPTVSTKSVTKYRYKWSTEESLPGWERTGEVRQVKASVTK